MTSIYKIKCLPTKGITTKCILKNNYLKHTLQTIVGIKHMDLIEHKSNEIISTLRGIVLKIKTYLV